MKKIIINGPASLCGRVDVSGSKNAALPILFACIIADGVSEIEGLPDIGDVRVALRILEEMGAVVIRRGKITSVDTRYMRYSLPDRDLISRIRASTYLIGGCLGRFGQCVLQSFGGCNFSSRPIDMHLDACRALGADINGDFLSAKRLVGAEICFNKASVGATVNSLLLTSVADGESVIKGVAKEPHIDCLIDFLISCGAQITKNDSEIKVVGKRLHGGKIKIIPDMIEAGSYLALGQLPQASIGVGNCPIGDMHSVRQALGEFGAEVYSVDDITCSRLLSPKHFSVVARPYPDFPTDLQPIMAPLMATYCGGQITDEVWRGRFGYLRELFAFGINYTIDGGTASIYPSKIIPATVTAPDLRGGMACIMAALVASGYSEIYSADTVLRGYENLVDKLSALGADIKIEET